MSTSPPKPHIAVLGAGVIGLQTTLTLLRRGYTVTLTAQHWPGDTHITYTSPWAGAHWRSQGIFDRVYDSATYRSWRERLPVGVEVVDSVSYFEEAETADLWWRELVDGFRVLEKRELPEGVVLGVAYKAFAIHPVVYMMGLLKECEALGVRKVAAEVGSLREVVPQAVAVVNCAGIRARELVGDEGVFPTKGQTVLVRGESTMNRFRETKGLGGWVDAVIRRPGAGTILGVSKVKGDWSEDVDDDLTKFILKRCRNLAPELLVDGEFEVISVQVGRRPSRKGGVRIETEKMEDGRVVVHQYGHGGGGFQNSIGSAEEAVQLLEGALKEFQS